MATSFTGRTIARNAEIPTDETQDENGETQDENGETQDAKDETQDEKDEPTQPDEGRPDLDGFRAALLDRYLRTAGDARSVASTVGRTGRSVRRSSSVGLTASPLMPSRHARNDATEASGIAFGGRTATDLCRRTSAGAESCHSP